MEEQAFQLGLAWLAGLLSGFLVSVPVGPTNVSIINEGAKRGFLYGFLIGLGSVTMEVTYCSIAFASFASLFESRTARAIMQLISFILVLWLGLKYLLAKSLPKAPHSLEVVERKLHPHTAYMTGFVRVLGNPSVLLFWIGVTATFISHGWVSPVWREKVACVVGVGMGSAAWFGLLSWGVSLGHKKFSDRVLLRMSQFSGASLLVVAVVIGWQLVNLLARR
jgi:threonine/homoserine/homoserine lactone efflux protein